ncbi:MAG: error-prone DNA polymerase [Planctomycetota bacterium]|nr:error-prone DNA polymerase [Planctomycetota bacterium]
MPESTNTKLRDLPSPPTTVEPAALDYAELDVTTNFSFLCGASHPDELVYRAAELGYRAIAITDLNTLAGVVRAHAAARQIAERGNRPPKLVIGSRLSLADTPDLLVWATDRAAYARLCRLLTLGKRRAQKGDCSLTLDDFLAHSPGLLAAIIPPTSPDEFENQKTKIEHLRDALAHRLSLATSCLYANDDRTHLSDLIHLSRHFQIPLLATNNVHYHIPDRRNLQDILTCIRHTCTIHDAGFRLFPNAERYLKSPARMHRLFADHPQALRRGLEIAEQCTFSLDELKYEYPNEIVPPNKTALEHLADLAWRGALERYCPEALAELPPTTSPDFQSKIENRKSKIPNKVRHLIEHELVLIEKLKYQAYFLTVYDLVQFARSRGILCQGRGSAANSAVCYCIGITSVDPAKIDLLFERFVSAARNEPPDIDVDFEHERREEVIQYIYEKYGRDRAGMTAEVISYRGRSAVRDVGKTLGLSLDLVDQMARKLDGWHRGTLKDDQLLELGLDPANPTIRLVVDLTSQLLGFPRHLSQHVGGMVMTRGLLCELVPIENAAMENRTVIEWDKDDIDTLGILKVDVLALGMLTCISKAIQMVNSPVGCVSAHAGTAPLQLHTIPAEDPAVYDMISDADTVGVFQIESRAQMSMLPRLRPRCFYDLVIEVAIVRPGPIQGNMVHPYLRRRNGEEAVSYPSDALRTVLEKTLGVPLFQEQAMRVAMVGAGFSAEEADRLRRAMSAWRKNGELDPFHHKIVQGMLKNGYTTQFAEQCFLQIRGFGEYGFPESHSASFALLVYVSAYLKRYYPAHFAAALLNSQPMGFYAPAQIVRDAQSHGVTVLPPDINHSHWDCTLESVGTVGCASAYAESVGCASAHAESVPCASAHAESRSLEKNPATENTKDTAQPTITRDFPSDSSFIIHHSSFPPSVPDKSSWGKHSPPLRLGLRQIKGLQLAHANQLIAARHQYGPFTSIPQFHRRTALPRHVLQRLADADAFASLNLPRRQALWQVLALSDDDLPLFDACPIENQKSKIENSLPPMPLGQEVMTDYRTTHLSLKRHPVALVRPQLQSLNITPATHLPHLRNGQWAKVAGLVLIRQRPGTAAGIVFITLEDETGIANLIIRPNIYDKYRSAARHAGLLQADGYIERQGNVIHLMAHRLTDLSHLLAGCQFTSRDSH